MATDISVQQIVSCDPNVHHGAPVFAGTRVPTWTLIDYLEGGATLETFLDHYPSVSRERAIAALELLREALTSESG